MTEAIVILSLFLLNGFFAMCEIALVSSRKSRLKQAEKNGSRGAAIALKLLEEPEKFLSTIQIGITLIGILAGAYGAEAFTVEVKPFLERVPLFAPYSEEIAFTSIIIVITYFSLIIGELVPKTIALNNPEKITIALSPFMRGLAFIAYPLVQFLSYSTKITLKLFFIRRRKDPGVTEEELKYMIDTGSRYGIIEKQEGEILNSVFSFGDKTARMIMIYRKNIKWLNLSQPKEEIVKDIFRLSVTKYPVCEGSLDRILGVVSVTDILKHIQDRDFDIRKYIKDPFFFPEHTPALKILEQFRLRQVHIGFVVDAQGSTVGLITVHDLIEDIVGELPEAESRDGLVLQRPDGSWLISGSADMKAVRHALAMAADPATAAIRLETFIKSRCKGSFRVGEVFELEGIKFEIVDLDGSRIDKVIVSGVIDGKVGN